MTERLKRFRYMSVVKAVESGLVSKFDYGYDDYMYLLLDYKDPNKPKVVGCDSGEPEDNSFMRDWCWVSEALNELADENEEYIKLLKSRGKELYVRHKSPNDPCSGDCWFDSRCPKNPVCNN